MFSASATALLAVGIIVVLITPGPTNTLLASAGLRQGLQRSLPLIAAELAGYLASISVWGRFLAQAAHAHAPAKFTTAPVAAMQKALDKASWSVADVDLFEVNEAFAIVAMIAMHDLGIPHDKINVNGGACALGHPIGASGARILTTLISALQTRGLKRGMASLCIGGGEATAVAVELID